MSAREAEGRSLSTATVRLLRAAAGDAIPVAFRSNSGEEVWLAEGSAESGIEAALRELGGLRRRAGRRRDGALRPEAGGACCTCPSSSGRGGRRVGWRFSPTASCRRTAWPRSRARWSTWRRASRRRSASMPRPTSLAWEISSRYEELNLLYSLGGLTDSFEFGVGRRQVPASDPRGRSLRRRGGAGGVQTSRPGLRGESDRQDRATWTSCSRRSAVTCSAS